MPIRSDLREFYRGAWREIRGSILKRARNCCEECGRPNRQKVWIVTGLMLDRGRIRPVMIWLQRTPFELLKLPHFWWREWRQVETVLTIAHLDHTPGHDNHENLRAWCQWCHLHYDQVHHRETRAARKDEARPLLMRAAS